MNVNSYKTPAEFLSHVQAHLLQDEIEHNLTIGLCNNFADKTQEQANYIFLVAAEQGLAKAALMITGYRAILSCFSDDISGIDDLALFCLQHKIVLPGVFGHEAGVMQFISTIGLKVRSQRRMMSHQLMALNPVPIPPGKFRVAAEKDKALLMEYTILFQQEANPESKQGREMFLKLTEERLNRQDLFVWEHAEKIVSIAAIVRRTPASCIVGLVYTPLEHRGKGYARACVYALSEYILSQGYKYCGLFTDLANPTSNHIYRQIGYVPGKKHLDVQL